MTPNTITMTPNSTDDAYNFSTPGASANTESCSHAGKTCDQLDPFLTRDEISKLEETEKEYQRISAERSKYGSDAAHIEVANRRQRLIDDPSPENIAACTPESHDNLKSRFSELNENLLHAANAYIAKHRELYVVILTKLDAALTDHLQALESEHRANWGLYGVPYSVERDVLLKSVARFRANARSVVQAKTLRPDTVREYIGRSPKAKGFFS